MSPSRASERARRRVLPARSLALAVCAALGGWTAQARAQNPRETPIGGRTATMGGAATAAGNDSAMPYLNPAGMAGVPGDIFGISASIYGFTHRSFQAFFFPNGTDPAFGRLELEEEKIASRSVTDMPSSVMYFEELGDVSMAQHLGVALVVPNARRLELVASTQNRLPDVAGSLALSESVSISRADYWVGPSYAIAPSEHFRVGVSLFAVYTRVVKVLAREDFVSLAGGAASVSARSAASQETNAFSVAPVVGFQLEVAPAWWLGAGAAIPSFPLGGETLFTASSSSTADDPVTGFPSATASRSALRGDTRVGQPLRLNAGIARDDRQGLSFAADVHYYAERREAEVVEGVMKTSQSRSGEVARRFSRRQRFVTDLTSVLDFSLGLELALTPNVAARVGGFTDMANTPELTGADGDHTYLRLDRFGATAGLGFTFGSFDSTIGLVYAHGAGKYGAIDSFGPNASRVVPISTTEDSVLLVLSGAVTSEEAKKQIRDTLPFSVEVDSPLGPVAPLSPARPAPTPTTPAAPAKPPAEPTPPQPPSTPRPEPPQSPPDEAPDEAPPEAAPPAPGGQP